MKKTIYHKHHIIPQYLNSICPIAQITIPLTVKEHAEAHRKLYEKHGRWQDKCAWLSLSGKIDTEEIRVMKAREANKGKRTGRRLEATLENARKGSEARRGQKDSLEVRRKRAETLSKTLTGVKRPYRQKTVIIDGVKYKGVETVTQKFGISRQTVYNRIKHKDWNWHYAPTPI